MLAGRVVLVPLGGDPSALARRLAREGVTVVLVTPDDDPDAQAGAGRLASEIKAAGTGRVAIFTGPEDAVADFVAELFRGGSP